MSTWMPPELADRIIDFLWDSQPDLHACSLVCRQWLPSSRHHLFGWVTVRPTLEFLTLLQSPSNLVPNNARQLDFRLWPREMDSVTSQILHHLAKAWLVKTIIIGTFPPSVPDCPVLSHVSKLCFHRTNFPSFADFARYLGQFPGLRDLELSSPTYTWPDARDNICPEIPLELQSLAIHGVQRNSAILPWLASPEFAPRTRGLSLTFPPQVDNYVLGVLSQYLRHLDGWLQYLQLDVLPSLHLDETIKGLELDKLSGLLCLRLGRGLYFSIPRVPTTPPTCRTFPEILDIAHRFNSRNQLTELILDVEIAPNLWFSKSDSDLRLKEFLAKPGVNNIPTLRFCILRGREKRQAVDAHRQEFVAFIRERELISLDRKVFCSDENGTSSLGSA
ncbi:hypothetical protein DFH06DRAFT_1250182 [Mycena polygramma]|nr:hypothetical protein DFH06DRAFT_1250182 [Mycena polygramma]